jgi:hypothetical protein
MDTVTTAVYGIGSIALLPLVFTTIGAIIRHRRERRRAAMLSRFADRMGY